jgi:hypothetical protein
LPADWSAASWADDEPLHGRSSRDDPSSQGAYLGLIVFALIAIALLRFVEMPSGPPRTRSEREADARDRAPAEVHGRGAFGAVDMA